MVPPYIGPFELEGVDLAFRRGLARAHVGSTDLRWVWVFSS